MTIDQVKTFLEEQEGKQKRKGMEEHGRSKKMKESAEEKQSLPKATLKTKRRTA